MSNPPSTGSPLIPSSSVDPTLLSPPTSTPVPPSVFYSQLTHSRHETVRSPHPQTRPFRPVLPYRTRHLATTASPPRHMTEILPITVSHRRPVVCSWAQCRPNNFWIDSFQSVKPLQSVRTRGGLSRTFRARVKRLICITRLYVVLLLSAPTILH